MAGTRSRSAVLSKVPPPPPPPAKVELLTVEAHPTIGRIERWRMSDGSVRVIELIQEFVEKT